MRFITRLIFAGVGLYILLKLGLIQLFMLLIVQVGKVIYHAASMSPVAAAIGILLVIAMSGKGLIDNDRRNHHNRH